MRRAATLIACAALTVGTAVVGRVGADAAAPARSVSAQRAATTAPRSVMYVGNNWAGTANVIDARTFAKVGDYRLTLFYAAFLFLPAAVVVCFMSEPADERPGPVAEPAE